MILLVDADILLFQMCFSHERSIDWGEGVVSKVIEQDKAEDRIERMVDQMIKANQCVEAVLCFTSWKNFRYDVYPEYKANRSFQKFEMITPLREWMEFTFPYRRIEMLEADDVMGVMATKQPDKYVIATIDKDLQQIPGRHYNWASKKRTLVGDEAADLTFYRQVITGDPTDNFKGIPGYGPKRANTLLAETPKENWWEAIVDAYVGKGLTEEYALQMARVARILRVEDYNFEDKEPILWNPKGVK